MYPIFDKCRQLSVNKLKVMNRQKHLQFNAFLLLLRKDLVSFKLNVCTIYSITMYNSQKIIPVENVPILQGNVYLHKVLR